jgi:hypothetical protein
LGNEKIYSDKFLRKARKQYVCCRCNNSIDKGQYYYYYPSFFKLVPQERVCLSCGTKSHWDIKALAKVGIIIER